MTPNEINDLKKRYNALRKRGKYLTKLYDILREKGMKKYAKLIELAEKCYELEAEIKAAEGDEFNPVPILFGDGFTIYDHAD